MSRNTPPDKPSPLPRNNNQHTPQERPTMHTPPASDPQLADVTVIGELDEPRLYRLYWHVIAATGALAVCGITAWTLIMLAHPAAYLPVGWTSGLRWWVLAIAYAATLGHTVSIGHERLHSLLRYAAGFTGPQTVPGLSSALLPLTIPLSTPLWPAVVTALRTNDAAPLGSGATGTHIELGLVVLLLLAAANGLAWLWVSGAHRLHQRRQAIETDEALAAVLRKHTAQ